MIDGLGRLAAKLVASSFDGREMIGMCRYVAYPFNYFASNLIGAGE